MRRLILVSLEEVTDVHVVGNTVLFTELM